MIKRTSRRDMYIKMGLISPAGISVDKLITEVYDLEEKEIWLDSLNESPHGEPWHTSFHASSFPGYSEKACPRKTIYRTAGVPEPEPADRRGRAWMDSGKDIEANLVRRLEKYGRAIISEDEYQTGFVEPDIWFTGNTDAIILPPRWNRFHPIEVKAKRHEKVVEMVRGQRGPDEPHAGQIKTYIGMAHDTLHERFPQVTVCDATWAMYRNNLCPIHNTHKCAHTVNIEPTTDGTLYYLSMDAPGMVTKEFSFTYDEQWMVKGRERLHKRQQELLKDEIPQQLTHKEAKHPFEGWGWSKDECQYCPFKKNVCKPDFLEGIIDLKESHANEFSQEIIPGWHYETNKERVINRWKQS